MMEIKFDDCIDIILRFEGGYTWDKNDPGGETNFGIDKRSHPDVDIKNLTLVEAKNIYRREYWTKYECEKVPSELRLIYFDCCVNQGPGRGRKFIQQALGLVPDGQFGKDTYARFLNWNQRTTESKIKVINEFLSARMNAYGKLAIFTHFGLGWSRRLMSVASLTYQWFFNK